MPKYQVLIEEVVQYVVAVEASDRNAAAKAALEQLNASANARRYKHAVSEREVAHVYKGDGPLPPTC